MGLLRSLFGHSNNDTAGNGSQRYVTENSFRENLAKQTAMSPRVVEQLRKQDVTLDTALKLEFFSTPTGKDARTP